ncbi:2-oxoacid dehydrogenases acyltransferase (catalytic domain) domain-containing protein [Hirsutella rhossiliensis]|uniref:Dihydrolipoamide acetyltransferase component of pyruvate dehydrogenase complex n=1 Tax=Hirsutella rhossiliensis TaxID=111463 RepID=A0A9P8SME2_9HYPO|nr:2-oxoacid dehydrogenases acyltransferase (catalytic domain) domain-containing protein [Hirsutella rhossiliensis]KAH0967249.1 2-oxoacid dehydrogenases acyltransferase (catalytic domain) domain-containing protein [Hirsutella rhossiliensis]
MFLQRGSRMLRRQLQASRAMGKMAVARGAAGGLAGHAPRWFTESRRLCAVKPVLLADIGEGIVECEVIQWFVEPGARVEEFSPLCEVQSDKASVEITSRFTGTVKKLYYEAGDMAKVGKPFVDIDIAGEAAAEPSTGGGEKEAAATTTPTPVLETPAQHASAGAPGAPSSSSGGGGSGEAKSRPKGKMATLATPAVRHLSKELKVDIAEIDGSGRDGRVLKEDLYKFVKSRESAGSGPQPATRDDGAAAQQQQTETRVALTQTQQQMFKAMTRSLAIPHFLYADELDLSNLVGLRARLNRVLAEQSSAGLGLSSDEASQQPPPTKLSYLPFIIKAVSMALYQFPLLNARVEVDAAGGRPSLVMRSQHNIGVAMDTPQGLVVPVVKNVGALSIVAIAGELGRLQRLAAAGRLSPGDMSGGTITVSNIGNIGGTYLSPVVVEREVAILGIGRMRAVPAFDAADRVVRKHVCNFSWSADHRVVDGATMARAAEVVRRVVEEPDVMVMHLR